MLNNINNILIYLGKEKTEEIELFVSEILKREYKEFISTQDIDDNLMEYVENYYNRLNYEELNKLKNYTGFSFRKINSVLRNNWNYEINGMLTPEIKKESNEQAEEIRNIIMKNDSLPIDIKVYRGVSLSAFKSYGISSIKELVNMKNKYILEDGFTSTSLLKEESFFYKKTNWGEKANIEIECLIPNESDDGVLLNIDNLSYSPNQNEYLINSSSLFKVIEVEIDERSNTAKMKIVLIPQKIWNPYDYEMERKNFTY